MVFFTCNLCGSPLKKNQVDKHVYQCRTQSVSCMDCQKDFSIREYSSHTSCISEAEKYGGGDWKAPSNFNKGAKKQLAWVDMVNKTLKNGKGQLSPPAISLLQILAKHDNVPRKKPKFMNFINNVARHKFDLKTLENVWNLLEEQWKPKPQAVIETPIEPAEENACPEIEDLGKKIKKSKKSNKTPSEDPTEVNEESCPEIPEILESSTKKKKRKKSKSWTEETCENATEAIDEACPEIENSAPKTKKRKKSKSSAETSETPTEIIEEACPEIEVVHKKNKKRKKSKTSEPTSENPTEVKEDVCPEIEVEGSTMKTKKRKKSTKSSASA